MIDAAQDDGSGADSGTAPFRLWPAQVELVWALQTERLVIMLKARQLGMSWAACGYALWLCVFHPGREVLLFSRGEKEAAELIRRVTVLYSRLPDWLRDALPRLSKKPGAEEIAWSNGSRVQSMPATKDAGSSYTASLVIMDEAAKIQWAEELYTAVKPTIDGGGQFFMLSSARGIGNLFHRTWQKASQGVNNFAAIFLPWWERPGRDQGWYDARVAEEDDPDRVKQEYPSNPTEAFLASGRVRFRPEWVSAQAANVRAPLPARSLPAALRGIPGLKVYTLPPAPPLDPIPTLIGADVAEGLEHGDYSDASVLGLETWEELASLNGHSEPDEFAGHLHTLAEAYHGTIVVERNNHGHAVLGKLKALGSTRIAPGVDGRPGWVTNLQSKPVAIDALAVALRDGLIAIRCQAALDELQVYQVNPNGSTSAPPGGKYHDDRVMSRAIALGWLQLVGAGAGAASYGGFPWGEDYRGE